MNKFKNKDAEKMYVDVLSRMSDRKKAQFTKLVKDTFNKRVTAEEYTEEAGLSKVDLNFLLALVK